MTPRVSTDSRMSVWEIWMVLILLMLRVDIILGRMMMAMVKVMATLALVVSSMVTMVLIGMWIGGVGVDVGSGGGERLWG